MRFGILVLGFVSLLYGLVITGLIIYQWIGGHC